MAAEEKSSDDLLEELLLIIEEQGKFLFFFDISSEQEKEKADLETKKTRIMEELKKKGMTVYEIQSNIKKLDDEKKMRKQQLDCARNTKLGTVNSLDELPVSETPTIPLSSSEMSDFLKKLLRPSVEPTEKVEDITETWRMPEQESSNPIDKKKQKELVSLITDIPAQESVPVIIKHDVSASSKLENIKVKMQELLDNENYETFVELLTMVHDFLKEHAPACYKIRPLVFDFHPRFSSRYSTILLDMINESISSVGGCAKLYSNLNELKAMLKTAILVYTEQDEESINQAIRKIKGAGKPPPRDNQTAWFDIDEPPEGTTACALLSIYDEKNHVKCIHRIDYVKCVRLTDYWHIGSTQLTHALLLSDKRQNSEITVASAYFASQLIPAILTDVDGTEYFTGKGEYKSKKGIFCVCPYTGCMIFVECNTSTVPDNTEDTIYEDLLTTHVVVTDSQQEHFFGWIGGNVVNGYDIQSCVNLFPAEPVTNGILGQDVNSSPRAKIKYAINTAPVGIALPENFNWKTATVTEKQEIDPTYKMRIASLLARCDLIGKSVYIDATTGKIDFKRIVHEIKEMSNLVAIASSVAPAALISGQWTVIDMIKAQETLEKLLEYKKLSMHCLQLAFRDSKQSTKALAVAECRSEALAQCNELQQKSLQQLLTLTVPAAKKSLSNNYLLNTVYHLFRSIAIYDKSKFNLDELPKPIQVSVRQILVKLNVKDFNSLIDLYDKQEISIDEILSVVIDVLQSQFQYNPNLIQDIIGSLEESFSEVPKVSFDILEESHDYKDVMSFMASLHDFSCQQGQIDTHSILFNIMLKLNSEQRKILYSITQGFGIMEECSIRLASIPKKITSKKFEAVLTESDFKTIESREIEILEQEIGFLERWQELLKTENVNEILDEEIKKLESKIEEEKGISGVNKTQQQLIKFQLKLKYMRNSSDLPKLLDENNEQLVDLKIKVGNIRILHERKISNIDKEIADLEKEERVLQQKLSSLREHIKSESRKVNVSESSGVSSISEQSYAIIKKQLQLAEKFNPESNYSKVIDELHNARKYDELGEHLQTSPQWGSINELAEVIQQAQIPCGEGNSQSCNFGELEDLLARKREQLAQSAVESIEYKIGDRVNFTKGILKFADGIIIQQNENETYTVQTDDGKRYEIKKTAIMKKVGGSKKYIMKGGTTEEICQQIKELISSKNENLIQLYQIYMEHFDKDTNDSELNECLHACYEYFESKNIYLPLFRQDEEESLQTIIECVRELKYMYLNQYEFDTYVGEQICYKIFGTTIYKLLNDLNYGNLTIPIIFPYVSENIFDPNTFLVIYNTIRILCIEFASCFHLHLYFMILNNFINESYSSIFESFDNLNNRLIERIYNDSNFFKTFFIKRYSTTLTGEKMVQPQPNTKEREDAAIEQSQIASADAANAIKESEIKRLSIAQKFKDFQNKEREDAAIEQSSADAANAIPQQIEESNELPSNSPVLQRTLTDPSSFQKIYEQNLSKKPNYDSQSTPPTANISSASSSVPQSPLRISSGQRTPLSGGTRSTKHRELSIKRFTSSKPKRHKSIKRKIVIEVK